MYIYIYIHGSKEVMEKKMETTVLEQGFIYIHIHPSLKFKDPLVNPK